MQIPSQHMEIERIYSQILGGVHRSIAICSANPEEGVTSIAKALAQRNLLAGHSTLLVDLNLYHPSFNTQLELQEDTQEGLLNYPQLINTGTEMTLLTGVTAPKRREAVIKLRKPGILEQCIEQWLQEFDTVIIDTSPVNRVNAQNIPPERVATACDGCLMVVLAGKTTEAMITTAVSKLRFAGANLLGCIINDSDNPPLKTELLREVDRLGPKVNWFSSRLRKWINNSRILSLEI